MASMIFGQKRRTFLKLLLFAIFLAAPIIGLAQKIYYVDSAIGNDSYTCVQAQNPATPKRTINGVMSCNPGPGDIVKFKGTFIHSLGKSQTIYPTQNGQVLYAYQAIQRVSGSTVTFNTSISGLNSATDYVTIYNSRRGNSGAFAVISFTGTTVTVDTSALPLGAFITETSGLSGAILRPVHFTAWDKNNPPVWNMDYNNPPQYDGECQTFHSINNSVIMCSYLKTITDQHYWKAFEIDGNSNGGNCDYHIFDHLEVTNGEGAIGIEYHEGFHSNYNIIQHNNFHHTGFLGYGPDEVIYYGNALCPERHHDYVQIMYNKVGPHRQDYSHPEPVIGDGIEIKHSAHNATLFGNEIVGIECNGSDDAPIKINGPNAFVANNYLHNINPQASKGCGISIINDTNPYNPNLGASGTIVANNIIANVKRVGIWILDVSNIKVLNNSIYNIFPEPGNVDLNYSMGIFVRNYQGPAENIEIKNNIVHKVPYGIGRLLVNPSYPISISSDYNIVYGASLKSFQDISQNTNDMIVDPMFLDAVNSNFHLQSSSPAIDNGTTLSDVATDYDSISRPKGAGYDIGAYEYNGTNPNLSASASANPTSGQAPLTVNFSGSATGGTSPYTYSWSFGDGNSSTSQNPSHTYSSAGTYTATLTVRDSASATASKSVTISATSTVTPLSASASASPTSGQAPLTVAFTASASGGTSPYTYSWTFGDGSSSTAQNPSHTYSSAGTYTATLTVTDSTSATASKSVTITVGSAPAPLAVSATATPTSGVAPLTVNFTGNATGGTAPYSYSWNFGDGTSDSAKNPAHIYLALGNYVATFTVTDYDSQSANATINISVVSSSTVLLGIAAETGAPARGQGGTTDPSPGNHTFPMGSVASLKSIPYTNYRFSKWAGDIINSILFNTSIDLIMDSNKTLSSTFCTLCADVNGDLRITPGDAQMAFDIYLKRIASPTWCELENADVNCDGTKLSPKVTPSDANWILYKYLKKGVVTSDCSGNSRKASSSLEPAALAMMNLTIDNVTFIPGQDILVPIILESPSEVTAFGFDLAFPSDVLTYIGLESTELTNGYDQLDANVISYQVQNQEHADAVPAEIPVLRVGGYKSSATQNPLSGVLVTLVFRVTGEFKDPSPLSIVATYDDIENASIRNGIINRQDTAVIRDNRRVSNISNVRRKGKAVR